MTSAKIKLTLSLTVVSMVLGFMVTLQYRQTRSSRLAGTLTASDTQEKQMESELSALKKSNASAQQKLSSLTGQLTAYEKRSAGASTALQGLQAKLSQERILAGLTPVQGPGISVTLMDGIATTSNIEQVLTHDWDVRSVINELFTAGAEAVSINNYRVVATSAIFCTGPVVRVNDHRLAPPFVIRAIGDPQTLQSALDIQGGVLDALRARKLRVSDPQQVQSITMPAFTGTLSAGPANSGS